MRRFAAACALAGAALLTPGAALAQPPTTDLAERLCEEQEGTFAPGPQTAIYSCVGDPDLSGPGELERTKALCEGAYRGSFVLDGPTYRCDPS